MRQLSWLPLALLLLFGLACQKNHIRAENPEARPWQSKAEQVHFMLTMASEITGEPEKGCITELMRRLEAEKKTAMHHPPPPAPMHQAGFLLAQEAGDEGERRCEQALSSCGNCHLPQKNNCNYRVYTRAGGALTSKTGQVIKSDEENIYLREQDGHVAQIANEKVVKTEWLNGGDSLHTWWNFKKFGKKGNTARTMLAIATENQVACINCHRQHGDFKLTAEGQHFRETGEVIKKIPLKGPH